MNRGAIWWGALAVVVILLFVVMAAVPAQAAAAELAEAHAALMPFQEGEGGGLASTLLFSLLGFVVASLALLLLSLFRRWRDRE